MRFNSKELACLAEAGEYDKEGTLRMKDKPDGLFKKGEVYMKRFFRLKGNLLFYYKDKEVLSDPIGVLVLERCTIELDIDVSVSDGFCIVYEGEDYVYKLQAQSEEERDEWIQVLHMASYECLKMQLQSLREQIQARTGRDPITQPPPTETGMEYETMAGNTTDDPAVEICLCCEGLSCDISGKPPNPFIVLSTIVPPQQNWIQHNNTEVVEESNNPQFLKTIGFGDSNGVDTFTRVKITVYHVKERMTGTMSQLGQAVFTLQDVLLANGMSLKLALQGPDPVDSGSVTVMSWINDSGLSVSSMEKSESSVSTPDEGQRSTALKRRSKRVETLRPMYNSIVTRTFRFDTVDSKVKLLVHEYMGESKLAFDIPAQLLKLWVEEEKKIISRLQVMGKLDRETDRALENTMDVCMSLVTIYSQNIKYIQTYKGPTFKPSVKKADKELEFIPVNLHLQRMTVINEDKNTTGWYDVITVAAFTAFAQKYKNGGLRRLLNQLRDSYSVDSTLSKVTKIERACSLVNFVYDSKLSISKDCDTLCQIAQSGTARDLQATMQLITEKVQELLSSCDSTILQHCAKEFQKLKDENSSRPSVRMDSNHLGSDDTTRGSKSETDREDKENWKWSGSHFVKSPTLEPWDMTRLNLEAAVMCVMSIVEDLVKNKTGPHDRTNWLNDISPAVLKLKGFIELVYDRVLLFLTYLQVKECKDNSRLMHTIKYRRDVCFSHALTSAITGFVTKLATSVDDPYFFIQIEKVGVLMQFEGLLSCHGDEMGMIEDFVVAVDDLSHVTFQIVKAASPEDSPVVTLRGHLQQGPYADLQRHCLCVQIPMQEDTFVKLPESLKKGAEIAIIPVLFNIGINEQASLAEKIGDTSLQERLNAENVAKLFTYIEKYQCEIGELDNGKTGPATISSLMQNLHRNTMIKKSKNTEILKLASEICRKLKGIRFTSCKSAKDRTAMSVTLEQVFLLQQEHGLASHVFSQALDCFRSEGVRRENTQKNIGARKYAFNSFQLLYVPKLYRPPNGTYGNVTG